MTASIAFVLQATEFERGWGCRPDGYVCFKTEAEADEFLEKDSAKKSLSKEVPDEYTAFTKIGYKEVKQSVIDKMADKSYIWLPRYTDVFEVRS